VTAKRRQEHLQIKCDGLSFAELLVGGNSIWNSRDVFPVVATLDELNNRYQSEVR